MNLLVADDQSMLRDALCQLLCLQEEVTQVLTAENGKKAIAILQNEAIDVAILDIEMPEATGLDVLEWIKKEQPHVKVIMVTTFKRPGYFERAIKLAADAFVLKDRSVKELMTTIHRVLNGEKEYAVELMESVIKLPNPLSEQEQNVLRLIAQGKSNQAIADDLFLSNGTVRNYVSTILLKLHADNRTEAVKIATEKGWV